MFLSRARSTVPAVLVLVLGLLPATQPLCDVQCAQAAAADTSEAHCPLHAEDVPGPAPASDGCAHGEDARHAIATAPQKAESGVGHVAPAITMARLLPPPPSTLLALAGPTFREVDIGRPPGAPLPLRI